MSDVERKSEFEPAVEFVLAHEGGLSENPNDPGGITNFGISLRFLREVKEENLKRYGIFETVSEDTIRNLTREQAKLIYKGEFWQGGRFEEISNQDVCNYVFDMVVNHGCAPAIRILQRSITAARGFEGALRADGILGSKTLEALNSQEPREILSVLMATRAETYQNIVFHRSQSEEFLKGWMARCYVGKDVRT